MSPCKSGCPHHALRQKTHLDLLVHPLQLGKPGRLHKGLLLWSLLQLRVKESQLGCNLEAGSNMRTTEVPINAIVWAEVAIPSLPPVPPPTCIPGQMR